MREPWAVRKKQLRVLYLVFLTRVVDLEMLSADGDTSQLVGQFATFFAGISFAFSVPTLLLFGEGVMRSGRWTPEHFFLATTMLAAGVMGLLTWDSAFPDRRDVLVLAPLPVRPGTLFAAKTAALFATPALAIVALNAFTGLLWPLIFATHGEGALGWLRVWPAYWGTMIAGGAFVFCALLTVQGLAANLLPRQMFLRVSALLQAMVLCTLLCVYFLEPSMESVRALTDPHNLRLLAWLPSYWFLGLMQQINGGMNPAFAWLARRAWIALAISVAGAACTLLLSYVRIMPKIIEQPEIVPLAGAMRWTPRVGGSLETAVTSFCLRTLLRSRQHRMILSFYAGIGLAAVVGYVTVRFSAAPQAPHGIGRGALFVSTFLICLAMMAMRVVAAFPITLKANWIFRVTEVRPASAYRKAIRRAWVLLGTGTVGVLIAATMFALYPWRPVAEHLAASLLLGMLLVELCLFGFEKIPFACSYLPGRANVHFAFWVSLLLGLWFLDGASNWEMHMLRSPMAWGETVLVLTLALPLARWVATLRAPADKELRFEEEYPEVVTSLGLR